MLVGVAWLLVQLNTSSMLLAHAIVPGTLQLLLILNVLIVVWRLIAVFEAFVDRRYPGKPGRLGGVGLLVVILLVAVPHLAVHVYGASAFTTFERVFGGGATGGPDDDPGSTGGPTPRPQERVNVLLMGIDSGPNRTQALTDSLMVISLDPVGQTVSMVSIPRDLVDVPLGNGDTFAPKINSLLGYANRRPTEFPQGGTRALEDAIGALLGVPIHYYAKVDLAGFVTMVDAVGGVDIDVARPLSDANYGGFGVGPGWSVNVGPHHFDGANALAYARIRRAPGENDFTRASRQQEVLIALRDRAVEGGNFVFSLPRLLEAVGDTVRTDLPRERLPEFGALAEEIGGDRATQVVMTSPMVRSGGRNHRYGSVVIPVPKRIAEMVAIVFTPPGNATGCLADPQGHHVAVALGRRETRAAPAAARGLPGLEAFQQALEIVVDEQQVTMADRDESLDRGVVEVSDERPEEAPHVERTDRLPVELELRPGQDLRELLQRPETAGQGHEGVGELGHHGLPLVERGHDPDVDHAAVRQLAIDEPGRDDARHPTTGGQRTVRDRAHQADPAAAVDELDSTPGELSAHRSGDLGIARIATGARTAEHADPSQLRHRQNPSSRRIGDIRRAAAPRCEIRFFSSDVQRPSVRPPGGSEIGSKMGS